MEPAQPPKQNMPMTVIGMLVFVSHFMLLAYFFISGNAFAFWGNRWIISLLFIAVLLVVGVGLLYLAESEGRKTYFQVVYGTGITYMVISALLYGAVAVLQFQERVIEARDAGGLFVLFLFFFATGLLAIRFSPYPRFLRRLSYIYLTIFGVYLVALAWKYLFFSPVLVLSTFASELLLLAIGGIAFGYLFVLGTRYREPSAPPRPRR